MKLIYMEQGNSNTQLDIHKLKNQNFDPTIVKFKNNVMLNLPKFIQVST